MGQISVYFEANLNHINQICSQAQSKNKATSSKCHAVQSEEWERKRHTEGVEERESERADRGGKTQWKLEITTHFGQTETTLKYVIRELVR